MTSAMQVGKQLVDLCRQRKFHHVVETLYANNIVSIEVAGDENMPARLEGLDKVLAKSVWWCANHEVHSAKVQGPYPHGDRFIVNFTMEVTPKVGPMAG